MFRFDVLGVILVVYSIEPAHFLLFCLDDAPQKWVCCCLTQNSAKPIQHSHGMFGIGEFVFLCRLRFFGSQHTEKYVEGSIDAFRKTYSVVKIPLSLLW